MTHAHAGFPESNEIVSGEPPDDASLQRRDDVGSEAGKPVRGKGFWLDGEPEKVAKDIAKRWDAQDKGMASRMARWELAIKRRDGDPYSKLIKSQDEDTYRVYTPRGVEDAPPSLNKTDDLCIKVVANLLVDPPKPECEPSSDSDEDRSSAEFSTRVLMNESTESGFNIPDHVRVAEELACSYSSAFVYAYLDPHGGGHRPREIMAPMGATTVGPNGQPVLQAPDPATGVVGVISGPPTLRYVAQDGVTITDDPTEAELEWLPAVCGEELTGKNLRFLPETCSGIRDCDAVLIASFQEIGTLKARFKDVAAMSGEQLRKLVSYRPKISKALLPKFAGSGEGTKTERDADGPPDDALALTITGYHKGTHDYPLGAYVVMGGGSMVLHRQEWKEQVRAKNKKMVERAAIIPVAQFRQFRDTKAQDPYGRGLVDRLSDGDPLRSFAIGAVIEYLHRVNNPHLFIPVGSGIQAKSLDLPRGTPIPYNAAGGGLPKQEEIAPLPPAFMEFYNVIGQEMDTVSGLEQAAQGAASASVQSGTHAQQIIEQALVALGGVKAEMESGYTRLCRVILTLIRMGYTKPQRMKVTGEAGQYKEKEWTGMDTGSTIDVKIQLGTSTMLSASAKSAIGLEKLQTGAITLEDYQRAEEGNVRALIGRQDNPALTRVRGQISDWSDGPPEDWQPVPVMPGAVDEMGQPLPPPVDPANPFADRRAVDLLQPIAIVRHAELVRAQQGTKYANLVPEWRAFLDAEELAMRPAAGVSTLADQQAAMQQQEQATQQAATTQAQQGEQQKAQQMEQQQTVERQRKTEDDGANHARALEVEERKAQTALMIEERKHQMAMEAKQADAQFAASQQPAPVSTSAPANAPQPYVPILPPDMTELKEVLGAIQQTMEVLATKEVPAPIVNVEAPIVNVPAPVVHVQAPDVHVEAPKAPEVKIPTPPKRKRRGTITGPDGKVYTVESRDVSDV